MWTVLAGFLLIVNGNLQVYWKGITRVCSRTPRSSRGLTIRQESNTYNVMFSYVMRCNCCCVMLYHDYIHRKGAVEEHVRACTFLGVYAWLVFVQSTQIKCT